MENSFSNVTDIQALDRLLAESHDRPVIVFKHSTTCPISSTAYREMSQLDAPVSLVVVQRARDVSREVEARTGVRHESPQTIILRHGRAVWSASHYSIRAGEIERALHENG